MESKVYALLQWEDLCVDVIVTSRILEPRKSMTSYLEGERITAKYQGTVYNAIISELDDDRAALKKKMCEPLKHKFSSRSSTTKSDSISTVSRMATSDIELSQDSQKELAMTILKRPRNGSDNNPAGTTPKPRAPPRPLPDLDQDDELEISDNNPAGTTPKPRAPPRPLPDLDQDDELEISDNNPAGTTPKPRAPPRPLPDLDQDDELEIEESQPQPKKAKYVDTKNIRQVNGPKAADATSKPRAPALSDLDLGVTIDNSKEKGKTTGKPRYYTLWL